MTELIATGSSKNSLNEITHFESMNYLWLISIIGLSSYLLALFFIFYGTIILLSDVHRQQYYNLSVASFISAILVVFLGRLIIKKFGIEDLFINDKQIIIHSKFIGIKTINLSDILFVKIEKVSPILDFLSLTSPGVIVATHNKVYKLKSSKYSDKKGFYETFSEFEKKYEDEFVMFYHKSKGSMRRLIFRFTQDTAGVIGLTLILIFTFLALWGAFAMIISPIGGYNIYTLFLRNPDFLNYELEGYSYADTVLAPPNREFWFGTDFAGRDLFARLVFGTSFTFLIAIAGSVLSMFFILLIGLLSSLNPGWMDNIIMRVADSLLSFPPFIFLIIFSAASMSLRANIQGGFYLAVYIGLAFVTWPMGARIIRAEVQQLMNEEFILASKHLGASKFTLLKKHILPQISPTILIIFTYQVSDIIIGTTLLGFIGFGSESTLTWGSDLSHALQGLSFLEHWWTIFFPSLFIFLLVFGLTLFSDSVRDNLDPRLIGGVKALPYEIRKEMDI